MQHLENDQPPASAALPTESPVPGAASALEVNITAALATVDVMHRGQKVTIMRNQDQNNAVNPDFARTSRKCPPFCVQPGALAPGVQTIGELEVLQFLKKAHDGDASIVVVDSRTPDWVDKGTIPGTINIPWDKLDIGRSGSTAVGEVLEKQLGAKPQDGFWNFDGAKTLVMFCNGAWCGQSPTNIKDLLKIGYPARKIFWLSRRHAGLGNTGADHRQAGEHMTQVHVAGTFHLRRRLCRTLRTVSWVDTVSGWSSEFCWPSCWSWRSSSCRRRSSCGPRQDRAPFVDQRPAARSASLTRGSS